MCKFLISTFVADIIFFILKKFSFSKDRWFLIFNLY
jgi:hypothetical protein